MSYSSEVLADAPLGYWRLDETSGTVAHDSSPGGHHGAYLGTPSLGVAGRATGAPAAAHLDGSGGVSITGFRPLNVKCVEAWVNFHGQVPGDIWALFAAGDGVVTGSDGSGRLASWVPGDQFTLGPDIRSGWHHVVVQWNDTGHELWVDRALVGQRTIPGGAYLSSFDLAIGWYPSAGGVWRLVGDLQDVAIYDHWLDARAMLRRSAPPPAPPPTQPPPTDNYYEAVISDSPVGYWRLDEAGGDTARDRGTGGHHGTYFAGVTHGATGAANHPVATHAEGDGVVWCDMDPTTIQCVEVWVNFDGVGPPSNESLDILVSSEPWPSPNGFLLAVDLATVIRNVIHGSGYVTYGRLNSWTGWRHLVTQWDTTSVSQYVDGVLTYTGGATGAPTANSMGLLIGTSAAGGGAGAGLRGDIQEVAVYDHLLTADAIMRHFTATPLVESEPARWGGVVAWSSGT